jgi:hypothetical protein
MKVEFTVVTNKLAKCSDARSCLDLNTQHNTIQPMGIQHIDVEYNSVTQHNIISSIAFSFVMLSVTVLQVAL